MKVLGYDVGEIAVIVGLLSSGAGAMWVVLRTKLGIDFASKPEIKALDGRVGAVEARLASLPTHADLSKLSDRLSSVESAMQVHTAELRGFRQVMDAEMRNNRDLMDRVDRRVGMLFRHELDKERAAEGRTREGD